MSYVSGNRFLTREEMTINAKYICDYLVARGWTVNAVAGMLGNMETESTINPAIWQNLDSGNMSLGFGLVQWTPATKLMNWANEQGKAYNSMDTQLERIIWEMENGEQFYSTESYPITFKEFAKSNSDPYYLAGAFLYNYERPAEPDAVTRGNQAKAWYEIIKDTAGGGDIPSVPDEPEQPDPTFRKTKPLSLLMKYIVTQR